MPELKGKILYIEPASKPNAEKDFTVCNFALNITTENNGEVFENYASFQVVNSKISLLDNINIGDSVIVHYSIKGSTKSKPDQAPTPKNPNKQKVISNNNAWKIDVVEKAGSIPGSSTPTSTPAPIPTPIPTPHDQKPTNIPEGWKWDDNLKKLVENLPF